MAGRLTTIGRQGAALAWLVLLAAGGCTGSPAGPARQGAVPSGISRHGSGDNWPVPPAQAERLLAHAPMSLVAAQRTPQGVAGAMRAEVAFPGDRRLTVKWKPLRRGRLDGWNNSPRKELAAYAIQRWFLDPDDYVVPTVAVRCVPLEAYRHIDPAATPSVPGTRCVLGTMALWLQHVAEPDPLLDGTRFGNDRSYAARLADFNVLTYLVRHRDGRSGNILVADREADRRVFAVDNGISFGGLIYNFLVRNWDAIRVPAVRRAVIDRLRTTGAEVLAQLGTLAELRADADGLLRLETSTPPIDADSGVRVDGPRVQFGLTREEIAGVWRRRNALLRKVEDGRLAVF